MSQRQLTVLLSIVWLWLLSSLAAANTPVLLPQGSFAYAISPYVAVYEDHTQQLTIQDMLDRSQQLRFTPSHAQALKFGISNAYYWLRFSVSNPYMQPREVVFTLSDSDFNLIEVFDITGPDSYQHLTMAHPARDLTGGFMQAYPVVLNIPPQSTRTYLLQVHSEGLFSAHVHLLSRDRFLGGEQKYSTLVGISLGWVLATLAFFVYVWRTRQLPMAVAGTAYCLTIIVYQPAWTGHLHLLFNISPAAADKIGEVMLALSASAHLAAGALLRWQGNYARTIQQLMIITGILHVPLSLLFILVWPQPAMLLIASTILLTSLMVIPLMWFMRSRDQEARQWLMGGHILVVIGTLMALMTSYNLLSLDSFTTWAPVLIPFFVIASLVAAVMLQASPHQQPDQLPKSDLRLTPALLSQLSHELRTPINGVIGMNELLTDTPLSHQQRDFTDTIALAGQDLLHVANEISDMARLLNGSLELERQPVVPEQLFSRLLSHFQHEAARKQVELVLDLSDDLPACLTGDLNRLQTLLYNLLSRALAYTENGEMTLHASPYQSGAVRGMRLQIQLSSTIIKQDELKSAFQILQHHLPVPDSRNDKHWNLLLTRHLLQRMQGHLDVESMTSQGASLTLYLPLPGDTSGRVPVAIPDGSLVGRRILIVDDNASLRSVIERQAKRWGMRPDSTYSGKEALAMLRNQITIGQPYDVIIIDHDMPVMNGLQLAERIEHDRDIAIKPARLMLTGLNLAAVREEALAAGIQQLLAKPADSERLRQALLELLRRTPEVV